MLTFRIDGADAISERLESMIEKIRELKRNDLGDELAEWQREDMHRASPVVKRVRGGVRTIVRPHSRHEVEASKHHQKRMIRRVSSGTARAAKAWMTWQARWSTRPILRTELSEALHDRMMALLAEKLRW
jgi:AcrR family transcriptional regulator